MKVIYNSQIEASPDCSNKTSRNYWSAGNTRNTIVRYFNLDLHLIFITTLLDHHFYFFVVSNDNIYTWGQILSKLAKVKQKTKTNKKQKQWVLQWDLEVFYIQIQPNWVFPSSDCFIIPSQESITNISYYKNSEWVCVEWKTYRRERPYETYLRYSRTKPCLTHMSRISQLFENHKMQGKMKCSWQN